MEATGGRRRGWLFVAVAALALVLRLATVGAEFVTSDEPTWERRSDEFYEALRDGRWEDASAHNSYRVTTMPGVTTMWIGAASRVVANVVPVGSAFTIAQALMALACALLVGLVAVLVARWVGGAGGAITGVLLASEPFLVAHGALLHTDELLALFGVAALVATAMVLGLPRATAPAVNLRLAAGAGALFGCALLTKVSGLMFVPSVAFLALWAALRGTELRMLARTGAAWAGGALAAVVLLYPALVAAPGNEMRYLYRSARMGDEGHLQFFLGEPTSTPGPAFYVVALALRVTPWFLVGVVVAAVAVATSRRLRGFGLAVACMGLPASLVLGLASKQFDRYGLPLLCVGAVLVGVAGSAGLERVAPASFLGRRGTPAGLLAALAVGIHSLLIAPWGLAYFNPAVGGPEVAQRNVLVGWWEGRELAGPIIAEHAGDNCDDVTVSAPFVPLALPCGTRAASPGSATYVVVYVSTRQRYPFVLAEIADRPLVATAERLGVTYVEVYDPRPAGAEN